MPELKLSLLSNTFVNQLPAALNAIQRRRGQVTSSSTTELEDKSLFMVIRFQVDTGNSAQRYNESLTQEVTDESRRGLLNKWNLFACKRGDAPEQDRYEAGEGLPTLEARILQAPVETGLLPMQLGCWVLANSHTLRAVLHRVEELGLHLEHLSLSDDDVTPGYRELTLRCWSSRFFSVLPEQLCEVPGVLYARVQSSDDLVEFLRRGTEGTMVLSPMIARDLGAELSLLEGEVL